MKKIFLPLLLVLFSFNSYSQFKGNPGKAKSSLDKAALKTELNEKILSKFSGMIRSEISKSMKIRRVPKILFIFDKTPEEADNIENLLKNIK